MNAPDPTNEPRPLGNVLPRFKSRDRKGARRPFPYGRGSFFVFFFEEQPMPPLAFFLSWTCYGH